MENTTGQPEDARTEYVVVSKLKPLSQEMVDTLPLRRGPIPELRHTTAALAQCCPDTSPTNQGSMFSVV